MRVPVIFQGKICSCGVAIKDENIKEIGIDFKTEQFVLRFTCDKCGLNGKLVFKTNDKKIEDLCADVIKMAESCKCSENKEETEKAMTEKEEIFITNFDQNKMGCLFIPEWTNEMSREFERIVDSI